MPRSIAVIHHMARSGGTLISKCIGCMQGVALLSEVHPFANGGQFNPLAQAKAWFGIDVQAEAQNRGLTQINWLQAIDLIHSCLSERDEQLVVRDWTHLDYTGVPWVNPGYELTTANVLSKSFEVNSIATVRHPIDQWNSVSKLGVVQGKLSVEDFLKGYRSFAEAAIETGYIRYEDFTHTPEDSTRQICSALKIEFDPEFITKWSHFTKITGDVSSAGGGRATTSSEIKPLSRRVPAPEVLEQFRRSPDFRASLDLLGYEE